MLLLVVVLANIFFMGQYIWNNGLGMFFTITGTIFLVMGIVIFIFFLSIDPGYGWTKSIDLTKNYIMIFTSMAVCIAGVVLIVTGQHVNELHAQSVNEEKRCQELIAGNSEKVLKEDWYSLRDQKNMGLLTVYLFQKKSNRNNYKIVATLNQTGTTQTVRNLTISSESIPQAITVDSKDSVCSGVFEENISIDFVRHQKLNEQVQFDLSITISGKTLPGTDRTEQEQTVHFNLKNKSHKNGLEEESNTQVARRNRYDALT